MKYINARFTNGKCYSLNPDRGTQHGWISNNAQDAWWWREVPCGGEGSGSNDCPDISLLQKKSVLEKDSESSGEDISYEVWKNKTQFFYDALGRKTQARPETRRYLFEKKKNLHNIPDKDFILIGNILKMILTTGDTCGRKGIDYGIEVENNKLKGGNYCYNLEIKGPYKETLPEKREDTDCICGKNDSLVYVALNWTYELR